MSRLTCLACGIESSDVAPTIVAYADPITVTVHVPVTARQGSIEMPRQVPGRYGAEWRCRDVVACRRRSVVDAMDGAAAVTGDAAEPISTPEPEPAVVVEPAGEPEGSWFS